MESYDEESTPVCNAESSAQGKEFDSMELQEKKDGEETGDVGKPSLKKISWVWPELKRRDAICQELEKETFCDEESDTSLYQMRQKMKVKGVHFPWKSSKVAPS